jgi:GT2 family glycosyltransferase
MRAAAVVIGRNEGPRLARCLDSVRTQFDPVVYVDSASTDGSVATAHAMGAAIVALDLSLPFSFGRARNAGAARALTLAPDLSYLQFVDADSEIVSSWFAAATTALEQDGRVAAVHGRVRERHPSENVYDRLFELEFDPSTEQDDVLGGMSMVRVHAFEAIGRYPEGMRTFEDHELSFRLRRSGGKILRLAADMAIHEAGMTNWRQWWTREWRAGFGRAELLAIHGRGAAREWWRAVASIWVWGALVPVATVLAVWRWGMPGLLVLLVYVVLHSRIVRRMRGCGFTRSDAHLYAIGRVMGKFPQLHGVVSFLRQRRMTA